MSEVFGYNKYADITAEHCIKGTYCDLALSLDGELHMLIEVKAIGLGLKDAHLKQAVDYAANKGTEWVVLTNGALWRLHRVIFGQPISQEVVFEVDLLSINTKSRGQVESLYIFAREGQKTFLPEYHAQKQAMSRHYLGALILNDVVLDVIRRELRRLSPNTRIDRDDLREALIQEVLKRDVTEGEKAEEAKKKIAKAQNKLLKAKAKAAVGTDSSEIANVSEDEVEAEPDNPGE